MAGDHVLRGDFFADRLALALRHSMRTPRIKAAARWWIKRARDLAADQTRMRRQRSRDRDPLPLSAAKLLQEKSCHLRLKPDEFEDFGHALVQGFAICGGKSPGSASRRDLGELEELAFAQAQHLAAANAPARNSVRRVNIARVVALLPEKRES
jgi:hypothetical protein